MLSTETSERLKQATALQNSYEPNDAVKTVLADKVLIMVVGPAAIGKSTIMNQAVEHPDFSRVSGCTTRQPRSNDEPGMYEYIAHTNAGLPAILGEIENRELVQYAVHPTTCAFYGSRVSDYRSRYNLLDCLSGAVEHLRTLPFENTITIGLIAQPHMWESWFLDRYPNKSEERTKRAQEAVISLEWLLDQPEHQMTWLENHSGDSEQTARNLAHITLGELPKGQIELQAAAKECLQLAQMLA